jgi:phosphoribosylanthranilate isomerase
MRDLALPMDPDRCDVPGMKSSRSWRPTRDGLFFKVCCIQSRDEVERAARAGAAAVGLVSAMPSGPGVIDEAAIAAIVPSVPEDVLSVLLTSETGPEAIAAQAHRTGARGLQLCDRLEDGAHAALRALLPDIVVWQVVHVTGDASVDEALALAASPAIDALLLDSGNPAARELGGTARVHDWSHSARIVAGSRVPVILAGGLDAQNVAAAIARVRPAALDICSGIRIGGALDDARLAAFARGVREASGQ